MEGTAPKITKNVCSGRHLEDELECDDNQSARCSTFKHFEEMLDQFQLCKVKMATVSFKAAYKHLLNLNPSSFVNPTDYEKELVNRGREMCLSQSPGPPFFGAVLLNTELIAEKEDYFYAIFTIVFGAIALRLHEYKTAIDLFQRCDSLFTADATSDPENKTQAIDILTAVAKTNIGCVYLITRVMDKAKDYLECALKIFKTFENKNKNKTNFVEINIVAIQTNLSLVYQWQKNYPAAVKLQDRLLLKAKDLSLPFPLVAAIHYNRAELLLELKEPAKAPKELETLDSLSERINNEDGIFSKFILSKICLVYQMIGEVVRAKSIAECLTFPPLFPTSLSPPLSPSPKSSSSASGSGSSSSSSPVLSSSPSSSSSSSSSSKFSASSVMSSFSLFLPDFEAFLGLYGKFRWDFLFAMILNLVDFLLNEENIDFVSFLDVFVPSCRETLGKNHPTYASFLYRQGVRLFQMERNLSSKSCFEEALSILTSYDFESNHPDLAQCKIALARLLLCENFQEVPQLKSCPDRSWREYSYDATDSVKMPETQNAVCDGRNDPLRASFHGGDVVSDSGKNSDALARNGACGFDRGWNTQFVASPKPQGDSHEINSKAKGFLGLKGGRRSSFSSGHNSQRGPSKDDFGTNHIGIDPSFLERHCYEYNESDKHWDFCGPYEDLDVPSGIHSEYNRSRHVREVCNPTPPSSLTYPGCPDVTKFSARDHSAFTSTTKSPPQTYLGPDEYQPQESSLNLVLMPKAVPAKTLQLPRSSRFLEDGPKAKSRSKSKANFPLTVKKFTNGDVQAKTPPNISTDVHVLAERPTFSSQFEREDDAPRFFSGRDSVDAGLGLLNSNSNTSADESLAALERRVAEACSLVERTLKERQEREETMKETEQKRKEERTRKEKQAHEKKEREAKEARETERRNERVAGNATSGGRETPSQNSVGAEVRQWLCEHYQRLCRVKFPCCGRFFPCHRCHNNSGCPNDNSKAREACYVECSICNHQQEDAFSGCQILPCSHKVHRECAIAMIQNGVRSCPICRYPLYSQERNE
ncbi:hypothetical protein AWC38_SpisGene8721 [Stylophora pistillata]|uniref:RING finger and CHY zinc finger domain-containing protein 1 n=1 Tax=Stylophora pistillata TaxID=50429 RepID=A0A2B4SB65_STYPI|nr:hypothetical protein AWC38_SpisGene8721 [Stylophora pistillata]